MTTMLMERVPTALTLPDEPESNTSPFPQPVSPLPFGLRLSRARPPATPAVLPRPTALATPGFLPLPKMSRTTVAGEPIPILAGMETRMTTRSLKALMELRESDQLLISTRAGKAKLLNDDDLVNLADDSDIRVIRRNLAS